MPFLLLTYQVLQNFLSLYSLLLIVRILLGWFNVDWSNAPFSWLRQITDPFLNVFRGILPTMGMMDFSPILAFMLLRLIQQVALPFLFGLFMAV